MDKPSRDNVDHIPVAIVLADIANQLEVVLKLNREEILAAGGNENTFSTTVTLDDMGKSLKRWKGDPDLCDAVRLALLRDDGTINAPAAVSGNRQTCLIAAGDSAMSTRAVRLSVLRGQCHALFSRFHREPLPSVDEERHRSNVRCFKLILVCVLVLVRAEAAPPLIPKWPCAIMLVLLLSPALRGEVG